MSKPFIEDFFDVNHKKKLFDIHQREYSTSWMFCGTRIRIFNTSKTLHRLYQTHLKMMCVTLPVTGDPMPRIGLGTWQAPPEVIEPTVELALESGYRHIDTAFNYNNEEAIGRAIKKWLDKRVGNREDLFITTKLPHIGNRASDVMKFVRMQLERLQLTYIDLYLIHVPFGFVADPQTLNPLVNPDGEYQLDMETNHVTTWKALEECQKQGLIRNLGLSNFNLFQIQRLLKEASHKPQVLQVELHAYFQQPQLRKFCAENNIIVTAYSPLGSPGAKDHFVNKYKYNPEEFPDILGHNVVKGLAEKYKKTPAQILLNFLVKENVVVIPKSANKERLRENIAILDFELNSEDKESLRKLDKGEAGRIFNFLFWKGVEKHPEYPFNLADTEATGL